MEHTERSANDALASQVVAQLARQMHLDSERARFASVLGQPIRRRTVVRLSFLQRLAQVAA